MNRHIRIALFGSVLMIFPTVATAQMADVDGNTLMGWCNTNINQERVGDFAMKGGGCFGYLTAIANLQMSGAAVGGRRACIIPNANMNQVVDVFKAYLKDHPERRHLLAANLAAEAFSQAFPCRSK